MHSNVPSIRSRRNAELENELKEYDDAKNNPTEDAIDDNSSVQQKGGDPTSPATTGWEKRYADLRSYSQKQLNEAKAENARLLRQLQESTSEEMKFPKTEDELEAWVSKYPDVAAMIETIAMKKMTGLREEIAQTKLTWEEEKHEKAKMMAFNALLEAHPDFLEIRETEEFHTWAEDQAKWVHDALYENETDAKAAIAAVDLFKFKSGKAAVKATPKVDEKKEAARSTGRSSQSQPDVSRDKGKMYESDVKEKTKNMSRREFDAYYAEIEKAVAEGRMVYDISGAAR
jgi:hypothetical protein